MMRRFLTLLFLIGGLALMGVSYFLLTTPWGTTGVEYSDPRLPYAASLFLLGVLIALSSAIVYEVYPERGSQDDVR